MARIEDWLAEYGTLAAWRTRILGDATRSPDAEALNDALALWETEASQIITTAESTGEPHVPRWFIGLTNVLANVCDVGPGTIDPTPLTRFCLRAEFEAPVEELRDLCRDCRGIIIRMINVFPPPANRTDGIPVVEKNAAGARITWMGTKYAVSQNWADWFEAALKAKGSPVGLYGFVGKATDALAKLQRESPELRALITKGEGNKGYFLTCFK